MRHNHKGGMKKMCGICDPKVWIAIAVFGLLLFFGLMPPVETPPVYPVAEFAVSTESGVAPLTVTFDASSSYDPAGEISEYLWDFGDGTFDSGSLVSHTYDTEGSYAVTLQVTDDSRLTSAASMVITVAAPEPEEPEPSEETTGGEGESGT